MAETVVGLFDEAADARAAVGELEASGFTRDQISVVTNDARGEYASDTGTTAPDMTDEADGAVTGAAMGATTGGAIGAGVGLLAGLGALAIPGTGPVLAAGPLMAALVGAGLGAGTGAVAGGLIGALVDVGVPEEEAAYYHEGVRRGGTLVTVHAGDEDRAEAAASTMRRHNVVDIRERGAAYRESGWDGLENPAASSGVAPFIVGDNRKETAGVASGEPISRGETASRGPSYNLADDEAIAQEDTDLDNPNANRPGTTTVY
jgi:hypothetical protein